MNKQEMMELAFDDMQAKFNGKDHTIKLLKKVCKYVGAKIVDNHTCANCGETKHVKVKNENQASFWVCCTNCLETKRWIDIESM